MPSAQPLLAQSFEIVETTIDDIHAAYNAGTLTVRQLVQMYLDRIVAYDKKGPAINAIISLNPTALEEADRLDAAFRKTGFVGPLHGIPVIMKDQADIKGMPTTLGSALFKDYMPDRDCFVVSKLKKAGVIFLGKATLGELGGGDTHGSLFGSTRNVYDLERTAGGSSGGSGPRAPRPTKSPLRESLGFRYTQVHSPSSCQSTVWTILAWIDRRVVRFRRYRIRCERAWE